MINVWAENLFDVRHRQEIDVDDETPLVLEYVYLRYDDAFLGVVMTDSVDLTKFRIVPRFDVDATRRYRAQLYDNKHNALLGLLLAHYATPNLGPETENRRSQFSEHGIAKVLM